MSGKTIRLGWARIVSSFSVSRSARATFSVPLGAAAVCAAGAVVGAAAAAAVGLAAAAAVGAGAVVAAGALVGLGAAVGAGALVGGAVVAGADGLHAASTAMDPPNAIRRRAFLRVMPLFIRIKLRD